MKLHNAIESNFHFEFFFKRVGPIDLDIVSYYLATVKAVTTGNNGRITILK